MTTPSKAWIRRRSPSITWKCTRTVSPALNFGIESRSWARSSCSMILLIRRSPPGPGRNGSKGRARGFRARRQVRWFRSRPPAARRSRAAREPPSVRAPSSTNQSRAEGAPRARAKRSECDEGGPPAEGNSARLRETKGGPEAMLYVGLDLSRKRLDWQALDLGGERVAVGAVPPDRDGLAKLGQRLDDAPVLAVIESMSGARFVHDQLERAGWDVRIADAVKARGLAPLACKTDKIDCWVLAELARLNLIPEIWLPDPEVRAERERARFRLHLVKHRSSLKNRVHSILFQHGVPNPHSDLFGAGGRRLLERLALPEPWRATLEASLALIDTLDKQIHACERELRRLGADHPYIPLLVTCPGIAWT